MLAAWSARSRHLVVLTLCAVVLVAAVPGPASAAPAASTASSVVAEGSCFPTEGHQFDIGSEGPRMDLTMYTSLFENLLTRGGVGVKVVGATAETHVVAVQTGVRFAGVGDLGRFLADPLARVTLVFALDFQLPMVPGDQSRDSDVAPVRPDGGSAGGETVEDVAAVGDAVAGAAPAPAGC